MMRGWSNLGFGKAVTLFGPLNGLKSVRRGRSSASALSEIAAKVTATVSGAGNGSVSAFGAGAGVKEASPQASPAVVVPSAVQSMASVVSFVVAGAAAVAPQSSSSMPKVARKCWACRDVCCSSQQRRRRLLLAHWMAVQRVEDSWTTKQRMD